jgi:hypothetical protein
MQLANLEPRLPQLLRPLPFCPRPFPGEAADSWIWRIGREFGYSPAKFLRAIGRPSTDRKDPGQVLTAADISYLATLARLRTNELTAIETVPAAWRLRSVRDQPFCGHCWLEDQSLLGFAYVRGSWMHAGRISCRRHGSWLYSVRDRLGARRCDPAYRAAHGIPTDAIEAMFADEAVVESTPHWQWIPDAGEYLKSLEAAIIGATAGHAPVEEEWGPIGAREFLNVVYDVTTWSLENFEEFKAPCPANMRYVDWASFLPPLFRFTCATLPPWSESQPDRSLRLRVDPDERRLPSVYRPAAPASVDTPGVGGARRGLPDALTPPVRNPPCASHRPFAPPALPGFVAHIGVSDFRSPPLPPSLFRLVGKCARPVRRKSVGIEMRRMQS